MIYSLVFTSLDVVLSVNQFGKTEKYIFNLTCNITDEQIPYNCTNKGLIGTFLLMSVLTLLLTVVKVFQERKSSFHRHLWMHRKEDCLQILAVVLNFVNQFVSSILINLT